MDSRYCNGSDLQLSDVNILRRQSEELRILLLQQDDVALPEYRVFREYYRCQGVSGSSSPDSPLSSRTNSPDYTFSSTGEIEEVFPSLNEHLAKESAAKNNAGNQYQKLQTQTQTQTQKQGTSTLIPAIKRAAYKLFDLLDIPCNRPFGLQDGEYLSE